MCVFIAVLKLTQRTSLAESECTQAKQEAIELRDKYTGLRRQHDELLTEMMNKMDVAEHINALAALKQYVTSFGCC